MIAQNQATNAFILKELQRCLAWDGSHAINVHAASEHSVQAFF